MSRIRVRDIVRVVALLALMCIPLSGVNAAAPRYVNVQVLALNDFHGNLEASSGLTVTLPDGTRVPAGGVAYLATHLRNLEAANPNTIIVSAGDLIGASPLVSALFHDEPTIEAFNLIGLDLNAVGNHEFDEGAQELLRMQFGGCHPTDGCLDGDPFPGADFRFLAANVVVADRGQPIFTPYVIRSFSGVRVAFIGMTLKGTPTIVTPSGVAGLEFLDEVETVNALVPEIRAKGVQAIVVLMHEGGTQGGGSTINSCVGLSGPVVPIVEGFDDEIDVVVSGHTHQAYNCQIDGKLVTSTNAFGRLVTKIDLTVDRYTGEVTAKTADNRIVTRTVPAAADLAAWVQKYVTLAAPLANRIVGTITGDITRTNNAAGESALGDVIADSQLLATADPGFGEAVVAFMNPGGIRADLVYAQSSGGELPGQVTYNEIFTVQPFGNSLVTLSLTGAQIDTLLEQQFDNPSVGQSRILQVSQGFSYSWSASAPTGSKVDAASILLNGAPIDPNAVYRVTVNNFLADGGDNFTVLKQGTDRLGGAQDLDAVEVYFAANSPVAPGAQNRITRLP